MAVQGQIDRGEAAGVRADFQRGLQAVLPLLPGVAVFGLLYGVLARQAGLTLFQTWGMSVLVFAGSAQFVAVGMWGATAALPIIVAAGVINLRHLLMGLSIGPYLAGLPRRWKLPLAFMLTDESYALGITEYRRRPAAHGYLLGASLGIYLIWPICGLVGAAAGTAVPDPARWGLDLIFPLAFLGLLSTLVTDRRTLTVAAASGAVAVATARWLPGTWYVVVAGVVGSTLGLALERRKG